MQIDWTTLVLQAINFLVLVWLLRHFLYRPVRAIIDKRRALSEEAFAAADKKAQEAEALKRQLEERQTALTAEREALLNKTHKDLEAERAEVLAAAKKDAEAHMEAARAALAEERAAALAALQGDVADLAAAMAASLLRNTASAASPQAFLDPLIRHIADLPAAEQARLKKDLEPDEARLVVVTAASLTASDQEKWRDRLDGILGGAGKIDFQVEADILGGAELRFPHARLTLTWADQLRQAQDMLKSHDGT